MTKIRRTGVGGGRSGRGMGAEGFFGVYLIYSEFTTHSCFNGRTISFVDH